MNLGRSRVDYDDDDRAVCIEVISCRGLLPVLKHNNPYDAAGHGLEVVCYGWPFDPRGDCGACAACRASGPNALGVWAFVGVRHLARTLRLIV